MATDREVQSFIDWIAPAAQWFEEKTGIPASLTIAQAGLETGWNKSAPGNNLFGVKAGDSWTGDVAYLTTWEEIGGHREVVVAPFRVYGSLGESLADRYSVLTGDRYKGLAGSDPIAGAQLLQDSGYATDSDYATKLQAIITGRKLTQFDGGSTPPAAADPLGDGWKVGDDIRIEIPDWLLNQPTTVIESVFDDPNIPGTQDAYDTFERLNPPADLSAITPDWSGVGLKIATGGVTVLVVLAVIVLIVLLIVSATKGATPIGAAVAAVKG